MDGYDSRDKAGIGRNEAGAPFRFPTAPSEYDHMLAAAYNRALDVLAGSAAPVIDADACAAWLAADVARDRRVMARPE